MIGARSWSEQTQRQQNSEHADRYSYRAHKDGKFHLRRPQPRLRTQNNREHLGGDMGGSGAHDRATIILAFIRQAYATCR